jgi:hypothetical protein
MEFAAAGLKNPLHHNLANTLIDRATPCLLHPICASLPRQSLNHARCA